MLSYASVVRNDYSAAELDLPLNGLLKSTGNFQTPGSLRRLTLGDRSARRPIANRP